MEDLANDETKCGGSDLANGGQVNFINTQYKDADGNWISEGPHVPNDEQEYLRRDYRKIMFTRFPQFGPTSVLPTKWKDWYSANGVIRKALVAGEGKYWTNQTLSYMRNRRSFEMILVEVLRPNQVDFSTVIDATANIGGDAISFAIAGSTVRAYEVNGLVCEMLERNVALYSVKVDVICGRFDYDVPTGALVVIDPPFEQGNNETNLNLSIDDVPICEVAQRCLLAGAGHVLLTMPRDYAYNERYMVDNNQKVLCYETSKNVKMFLISRRD